MTKYYYEGKLIRTSKRDNYTHAIIWRNRVVACCGGYDRALKRYNQEFNYVAGFTACTYSSDYGNHSLEKARELKLVELNKIN